MFYLIFPIIFSSIYCLCDEINKKILPKSVNPIINSFIFIFFLSLIYIFKSYLYYTNINTLYFSLIILFLLLIFFLINFKKIIKNIYIFINKLFAHKLIFLLICCYYILILFPAFDEDSLRYHLPIAKLINDKKFFEFYWLDYLTIGTSEYLNSFFLDLKFDNGSSFLNFFSILYIILSISFFNKKFFKNKISPYNLLILFSAPYFIALMTSQKLYLLPCYISVFAISYQYLNRKKITLSESVLLSIGIIFMFITKATFIPYALLFYIISVYFFSKKEILFFLSITFFLFIALYFPIIFFKIKIFKDPLLPIVQLNQENYKWFLDYKYFLTEFQMDYTQRFDSLIVKFVLTPVKLIFPLSLNDIFKCFGISILFIFTVSKKNKTIVFFTIFMFLNVFLLLNTQTRWFLPLLVFLTLYAQYNKFIMLNKLIVYQTIGVLIILFPLALLTILGQLKIVSNEKIINQFQNSNVVIKKVNKITNGHKVFTNINQWYRLENYIPIYYPKISTKQNKNIYLNKATNNDYVLWSNKHLDVKDFIHDYLNCKKYKLIKSYTYNNTRLFLLEKITKVRLYQLTGCS